MAVNTRDLKICIIGAGLSGIQNLARNVSLTTKVGMGGLTSALALAKQGFTSIEVFETASSLGFVGAGIQLAPNMARVLDRLGVWSDIEQDAVKIYETSIRGASSVPVFL